MLSNEHQLESTHVGSAAVQLHSQKAGYLGDLFFSGEDLTHLRRLQRMGTVPNTDLLSFITLIIHYLNTVTAFFYK